MLFCLAGNSYAGSTISITNVWVPDAPPVVKVRAGYFVAKNKTGQPVKILKVSSKVFERVEMHESIYKDGTASMVKKNSVTIPAKSDVHFKAGGLHLMLIGVTKALPVGSKIPLEFEFSNKEKLSVIAVVKPAGTEGMDHSHHHHHH